MGTKFLTPRPLGERTVWYQHLPCLNLDSRICASSSPGSQTLEHQTPPPASLAPLCSLPIPGLASLHNRLSQMLGQILSCTSVSFCPTDLVSQKNTDENTPPTSSPSFLFLEQEQQWQTRKKKGGERESYPSSLFILKTFFMLGIIHALPGSLPVPFVYYIIGNRPRN